MNKRYDYDWCYRRAMSIRRVKAKHPEMSQLKLAAWFGLDQGEVHLILADRIYTKENPTAKPPAPAAQPLTRQERGRLPPKPGKRPRGRPQRALPQIEIPKDKRERDALMRKVRAEQGLTYAQLAKLFGLAVSSVSRILSGDQYGLQRIKRWKQDMERVRRSASDAMIGAD